MGLTFYLILPYPPFLLSSTLRLLAHRDGEGIHEEIKRIESD